MTTSPRRPGRPPAEPTVPLTVRVPAEMYDALARQALRLDVPISQLLRELMRRYLSRASQPADVSNNPRS